MIMDREGFTVSPPLFKNSAEKEKTIFQIFQAVISRLPSFCAIDSGRGPSPNLSILLHIYRTQRLSKLSL
ncbi:hypothetical protein SRHO_G00314030 [Serrasalmus rhombeus]